MRCEEVRPLLSVGLDGELEEGCTAQVQAHLAGCALCAAEREALSVTVRLLRAVPEADPPAELRRRIGVTLLEMERRSQRRWLGLSWLARPQSAGWTWGAALGTVAATVGLLATRGPETTRPVATAPRPPAVTVPALPAPSAPSVREETGQKLAAAGKKQAAPKDKDNDVIPPATPPVVDRPMAVAAAPAPQAAVTPVKTAPKRAVAPPSPPRRRVQTVRRPAPPPPSRRSEPTPPQAPGSDGLESTARDMPLVARSDQDPMPHQPDSDPSGVDHRAGTVGMTQMASGMTEAPSPAAASDDLVELRRRLLDRPLHVPELGELKPTRSSHADRDGWIRF